MRRKGRFKAFLENTAITYRPPTLKAPETPLSRELDALERLVRSGFREGSIFGGEQRGTPTLCHSTFSPDGESISTFAIISPSIEWAIGVNEGQNYEQSTIQDRDH